MRIRDVMRAKDSDKVVTIAPDATVRDLVSLLSEHNIGAVIVSEDGESIEGIVSERDVVRRLGIDSDLLEQPISAVMTAQVQTCTEEDSVHELMQVMTERRFRHIPVTDQGRLVGVISIGDVVKTRIGELEFERDQLDSYVHQN